MFLFQPKVFFVIWIISLPFYLFFLFCMSDNESNKWLTGVVVTLLHRASFHRSCYSSCHPCCKSVGHWRTRWRPFQAKMQNENYHSNTFFNLYADDGRKMQQSQVSWTGIVFRKAQNKPRRNVLHQQSQCVQRLRAEFTVGTVRLSVESTRSRWPGTTEQVTWSQLEGAGGQRSPPYKLSAGS